VKHVETSVLSIAYHESGDPAGVPAILLHGFPYDVHTYEQVAPLLAEEGFRVIVPFLRGYGATRFLRSHTLRSGEQAALGNDLRELMDGLHIERALVGGYDWGGRAACVLAALWPERVLGLTTCMGYNIQNIARSSEPAHPDQERRHWYQYYFHSERGRAGLANNRFELCALLWRLWSPNWMFTDADYARSASAFDNPDFVDVVIHSYRHRYALVAGDSEIADVESHLAQQPQICVPTIALDGAGDGVAPPPGSAGHRHKFGETYERRVIPKVGHNLPQEAPQAFADAIIDLGKQTSP
jgi:pimeloyl-ACP methyl ester carboxylesterase